MKNLTPELIAINERIKSFDAKRQAKKERPKIEVKVEFEANSKGVKQFLKLHGYNTKDFRVRNILVKHSELDTFTLSVSEISFNLIL